MPLKNKKGNPFRDAEIVTCVETFLGQEVTIRAGQKLRGDDPIVAQHWGVFREGDLLPAELAKIAAEAIPLDPPTHEPHVYVPPSVPAHRQVESTVDCWFEGGFAPGSPGAQSGRPSGFGSAIRRGQIFDALQPVVREHPEWFVWVKRPVMLEDLDRIATLEKHDAAA